MNNERKKFNLGYIIIDGPLAIYQPNNDFEWYEQDVFIKINIVGERDNINQILGHESISIWSDNTMNKEKDFFIPIIRHAKWIKTDDLDKIRDHETLAFPDVKVSLGNIKNLKKIENDLINFQKQINDFSYIQLGLSLQRDIPEVKYDKNFTAYSIFFRNGVQSIEFNSEPISGDSFKKNVFSLFNTIKNQMEIFDNKGWIEKYNIDFNTLINTDFYKWDYSTKI